MPHDPHCKQLPHICPVAKRRDCAWGLPAKVARTAHARTSESGPCLAYLIGLRLRCLGLGSSRQQRARGFERVWRRPLGAEQRDGDARAGLAVGGRVVRRDAVGVVFVEDRVKVEQRARVQPRVAPGAGAAVAALGARRVLVRLGAKQRSPAGAEREARRRRRRGEAARAVGPDPLLLLGAVHVPVVGMAAGRVHVHVDLHGRHFLVVHALHVPHQAVETGRAVMLVNSDQVVAQLVRRLIARWRRQVELAVGLPHPTVGDRANRRLGECLEKPGAGWRVIWDAPLAPELLKRLLCPVVVEVKHGAFTRGPYGAAGQLARLTGLDRRSLGLRPRAQLERQFSSQLINRRRLDGSLHPLELGRRPHASPRAVPARAAWPRGSGYGAPLASRFLGSPRLRVAASRNRPARPPSAVLRRRSCGYGFLAPGHRPLARVSARRCAALRCES
eukprot:scaffold5223_cov104-Isochrysis_galbana.AAC.1